MLLQRCFAPAQAAAAVAAAAAAAQSSSRSLSSCCFHHGQHQQQQQQLLHLAAAAVRSLWSGAGASGAATSVGGGHSHHHHLQHQHHQQQHQRAYASDAAPPPPPPPANAMALVKEVRALSGAPISDVRACLAAAGWDVAGALEGLRLRGLAAAVKKASRHASEGLVAVAAAPDMSRAAAVEVNSETDFVGRSEPFQQLAAAAARAALELAGSSSGGSSGGGGVVPLEHQALSDAAVDADGISGGSGSGSSSVGQACAAMAGHVRENVALRRGYAVAAPPGGVVAAYVHMPLRPGAGRIAALVALGAPAAGSAAALPAEACAQLAELGAQLAMHAAGMNTRHVSRAAMPREDLDAAREGLRSQVAATMPGKPAAVLDKVVEGRLAKWCKETCLLDQTFVLDDSVTVAQLLKRRGQELGLGGPVEVAALLRMQVGEGLERDAPKQDFAAEVAAMAAGGGGK